MDRRKYCKRKINIIKIKGIGTQKKKIIRPK